MQKEPWMNHQDYTGEIGLDRCRQSVTASLVCDTKSLLRKVVKFCTCNKFRKKTGKIRVFTTDLLHITKVDPDLSGFSGPSHRPSQVNAKQQSGLAGKADVSLKSTKPLERSADFPNIG